MGFCLALAAISSAQQPDVKIKFDATLSYRAEHHGPSEFRAYSTLGRYSTVGLTLILEPGLRVFVTEKLGRISGDPDADLFDQYYIEDEGNWRVGKQILPFGEGLLVHESVPAIRADSGLILEGVPVAMAFCDAGPGRQRGVVARLGSTIGISLFEGRHFGISGSSLTLLHEPERAMGVDRGYKQALEIGLSRRLGLLQSSAELISFTQGETSADEDMNVGDLQLSLEPKRAGFSAFLGYSLSSLDNERVVRLGGSVKLSRNIALESMVREKNSHFWDYTLQTRLKF